MIAEEWIKTAMLEIGLKLMIVKKSVCCFNNPRENELCNIFISNWKRQKTLAMVVIYFKINRVQDKVETFDAEKAIKQYWRDYRFSKPDSDTGDQSEFYVRGGKRRNGETSEYTRRGDSSS